MRSTKELYEAMMVLASVSCCLLSSAVAGRAFAGVCRQGEVADDVETKTIAFGSLSNLDADDVSLVHDSHRFEDSCGDQNNCSC
jgi:hypothetical protein